MNDQKCLLILKRVGAVLLVMGVIDIGLMIYCIINHISYSSSFNIFAVWLGILLMRGSLWAASKVRFLITLFIASGIGLIAVMPFLQPNSLTLAELRHASLVAIISLILIVVLLSWIVVELNKQPVLDAFKNAGRKVWPPIIPAIIGICLTVAIGIGINFMTSSQIGEHAKALAMSKLGTGYKYHVSSMRVTTSNQHTSVAAVVTAWDDNNDVQQVPVEWEE